MRDLSNILDDYFARREIGSDEMNEVIKCRDKCIENAAISSLPSTTSYQSSFDTQAEILERLYPGFDDSLMEIIKGKKVIELGPGCNPMHKWLFERGASDYTGVEMLYPQASERAVKGANATIVGSDALSYLLSLPDESAVVVSRGVLNTEVMPSLNYMKFLLHEIYRVTPKSSGTIHAMGLAQRDEKRMFEKAGFTPLVKAGTCSDFNFAWIK